MVQLEPMGTFKNKVDKKGRYLIHQMPISIMNLIQSEVQR